MIFSIVKCFIIKLLNLERIKMSLYKNISITACVRAKGRKYQIGKIHRHTGGILQLLRLKKEK